MSTYKNALNGGILDDVSDSFVLLPNANNHITIDKVTNTAKENIDAWYITQPQEAKGTISIHLMEIKSKNEFNFNEVFSFHTSG